MIPGWQSTTQSDCVFSSADLDSVQSIGLRVDRLRAEARAVVVSFPAVLQTHAPAIVGVASEPLPAEFLRKCRSLELDASTFDQRDEVSLELNSIAERLIQQLLAEATDTDDILTIGCHGTGIWNASETERPRYSELLDTARLAESFGKSVVASFPARDLARNGIGGPLEAHGLRLLLADRSTEPGHRWRGLVDISSAGTDFTMVPSLLHSDRRNHLFSANITVGHRLLSELVLRRGDAETGFDYGKLAAAGRVIPELVELWAATVASDVSESSWSPNGTSVLPLMYSLDQSIYKTSSVEDHLASATHFLAQQIVGFVLHRLPASQPVGELFVMGDGARNRLLVRRIEESLTVIPVRKLDELGQDRSLLAAAIAALAMMHVWHVPLNASRGGEVPRVLGSITPGSPSNWQRLLHEMTSTAPWLLPLREAV